MMRRTTIRNQQPGAPFHYYRPPARTAGPLCDSWQQMDSECVAVDDLFVRTEEG